MERLTHLEAAITLMREAQARLDAGGFSVVAAHLENAIGFAETEVYRLRNGGGATH